MIPADAELTPRDEAFPAWDQVPDKLKAFYARQMEVYAGLLGERRLQRRPGHRRHRRAWRARQHADHLDLGGQRRQHGGHDHRLVQRADHAERHPADRRDAAAAVRALRRHRRLGRRADGSALRRGVGVGRQHPVPVGQAGRLAPGRHPEPDGHPLAGRVTDTGGLRSQFTHVTDVAPTILDVAGHPGPVDGGRDRPGADARHEFAGTLTDPAAPERHTQQYFETVGNRAMYKDGWWLAVRTPRIPWVLTPEALKPYAPGVWDPDADPAELYYLPDDLQPGARPGGRASGQGRRAEGAVLGGGRAVQGAAAAGDPVHLLRHAAAAARERPGSSSAATCRTCCRG